jgi:hypothetical protein
MLTTYTRVAVLQVLSEELLGISLVALLALTAHRTLKKGMKVYATESRQQAQLRKASKSSLHLTTLVSLCYTYILCVRMHINYQSIRRLCFYSSFKTVMFCGLQLLKLERSIVCL